MDILEHKYFETCCETLFNCEGNVVLKISNHKCEILVNGGLVSRNIEHIERKHIELNQ